MQLEHIFILIAKQQICRFHFIFENCLACTAINTNGNNKKAISKRASSRQCSSSPVNLIRTKREKIGIMQNKRRENKIKFLFSAHSQHTVSLAREKHMVMSLPFELYTHI